MALSRTWYTDANVTLPDVSTTTNVMKSWFLRVKQLIVGGVSGTNGTTGAPPVGSRWTVVSSSNSVSAGAADYWAATTDIVRAAAGVAHSWVVLQSPIALDGGVPWYICIDVASAADGDFIFIIAKTAFTGGSTTARPTSVDETISTITQTKIITLTALATHKLTRITDADGNFWLFHTTSGSATGFHCLLGVQRLANTRTGDSYRVAGIWDHLATGRGAGGQIATSSGLYSFAPSNYPGGIFIRSADGVTGQPETIVNSGIMAQHANYTSATAKNNADGLGDGFPCIIWTKHLTNKTGIRGTLPDCMLGNAGDAVGTIAPATGTPEHTLVGYLWLPNGSLGPTL